MDRRRLTAALVGTALLLGAVVPAPILATDPPRLGELPEAVGDLKLDKAVRETDGVRPTVLAASLRTASGAQQVVIRLKAAPTGAVKGAAKQKTQLGRVNAQQKAFIARAKDVTSSFKVLGRTQTAINTVLARVNAKSLAKLSRDRAVLSIRPVVDYQLDLSETVPYIGGSDVQAMGATGQGITVAVLDSGIDYTHAALGGPGTKLAYENAYGTKLKHEKNTKINDAYKGQKLYPTAKVIGGYDFVGELWVGGADSPPLAPDPDPIPCGPGAITEVCDGSHGSHVADIIAGAKGVAPDATLLAVKVCSSISTACSGVALIQGMDFALDPNGDGSTADAADIINMSLGSPYGPAPDDDLSAAVRRPPTRARSSSRRPATPATSRTSRVRRHPRRPRCPWPRRAVPVVAGLRRLHPRRWHAHPGARPVRPGPSRWRPMRRPMPRPVRRRSRRQPRRLRRVRGGLADRQGRPRRPGTCTFTLKIANIARGGGKIGVIGLITPGDPFDGSLGGCPDNICAAIPGYMVGQSTSTAMKAAGTVVTFDPANGIPLVGHVVGSSARGPGNLTNLIKPEIGAPGASVSAVAGSGTGTASFGGTSGATPMVAGSAALLQGAFPSRGPLEIKAVLMNTADTNLMNQPAVFGGPIAPITRIGGGEVRVDRAYGSPMRPGSTATSRRDPGPGLPRARRHHHDQQDHPGPELREPGDDPVAGAELPVPGGRGERRLPVTASPTAWFRQRCCHPGARFTIDPASCRRGLNSGGNGANGRCADDGRVRRLRLARGERRRGRAPPVAGPAAAERRVADDPAGSDSPTTATTRPSRPTR